MTKFQFTENNIDFIAFKYGGSFWCVCFDGFKHGRKECKMIADGLQSAAACYDVARGVYTAKY